MKTEVKTQDTTEAVANPPMTEAAPSPFDAAKAAIAEEYKQSRAKVLEIIGRTPGFSRSDRGAFIDGADLRKLHGLLKGRLDDQKRVARLIVLITAAKALAAL